MEKIKNRVRITQKQKDAKGKQWYKDKIAHYSKGAFKNAGSQGGLVEEFTGTFKPDNGGRYNNMRINYDLYNGIIRTEDFSHVHSPFGEHKLPTEFTNKDIVSPKIKAMMALEMKRPFSHRIVAINEEATTRKEQEEFKRYREFVVNSIKQPIIQQAQMEAAQETKGKELTPEEQQEIQKQVQEKVQALTPPEVDQYMKREHQDPAEILMSRLLKIVKKDLKLKRNFNKGFKNVCLVAQEIYWLGEANRKPAFKVCNPMFFDTDQNSESEFIEDNQWAAYESWMTPSQIVAFFGDSLTDSQIDDIYEQANNSGGPIDRFVPNFDFTNNKYSSQFETAGLVRVLHVNFKALRKIGFLTSQNGKEEIIVDENYKLNAAAGDLKIIWKWIPEAHEGYQIGEDIYPEDYMRPVPGQYRDLDNLYTCKLSYYGAIYEKDNSLPTSPMDRMKNYQYLIDIVLFRIENLMASDKGRILLMNLDVMAKSSNLDMEKWLYYLETLKIGFMRNSEEGARNNLDVSTAAKTVDMSLISDIQKYMMIAEYLEKKCADAVSVNEEMLGNIMASQAVGNTQQALARSSSILEPFYELHNAVKENVTTALIELTRVIYSTYPAKKLSYVLDDMSLELIKSDPDLLANSSYGLYVSDTNNAHQAMEDIKQLTHAAMQGGTVDLSDIAKVLRADGIKEAEELLVAAEDKKRKQAQQEQVGAIEAQAEADQKKHAREMELKKFDRETELLKIDKKGEYDLKRQVILAAGFDEDKDRDEDGIPDIAEYADSLNNVRIENSKLEIERKKNKLKEKELDQNKEIAKEKNKIDKIKASKIGKKS